MVDICNECRQIEIFNHMAYFAVHSRAVASNFWRFVLHRLAISPSNGSSEVIVSRWGRLSIDWFASLENRQLARFATRLTSPTATVTDAFSTSWSSERLGLLVPPFPLVARVAAKALDDRARAVLVPAQHRWPLHSGGAEPHLPAAVLAGASVATLSSDARQVELTSGGVSPVTPRRSSRRVRPARALSPEPQTPIARVLRLSASSKTPAVQSGSPAPSAHVSWESLVSPTPAMPLALPPVSPVAAPSLSTTATALVRPTGSAHRLARITAHVVQFQRQMADAHATWQTAPFELLLCASLVDLKVNPTKVVACAQQIEALQRAEAGALAWGLDPRFGCILKAHSRLERSWGAASMASFRFRSALS
jgi:hypothetical protein